MQITEISKNSISCGVHKNIVGFVIYQKKWCLATTDIYYAMNVKLSVCRRGRSIQQIFMFWKDDTLIFYRKDKILSIGNKYGGR